MSVLEKNMEAFKKRYPEYYQEMQKRETLENEKKEWEISVLNTKEDASAVIVQTLEGEIRLNSLYHPKKEAERWADQFDFSNLQVNVLLFGLGNGCFLRELIRRIQDDANIVVYEPEFMIFKKLLSTEDMTDIIGNRHVYLSFAESEERLTSIIRVFSDWLTVSNQISCIHPGYEKLYPAGEKIFWNAIRTAAAYAEISNRTAIYFSRLSAKNAIRNLYYIKESNHIGEFTNKVNGNIPAIIVSAGPSLDKNIKELKKAEGRAFIVATDTAVRHLEKNHVSYDCVLSIDPEKPVEYFMEAPGVQNKPFFCDIRTNPEIMQFHTGRKIWFSGGIVLDQLYQKQGLKLFDTPQGGSVATAALGLVCMMGIWTVILVGQDLAYGEHGTHAGGEVSENPLKDTDRWVEGMDGKPVRSRGDWLIYLKWFEDQAKEEKLHLIDATEGGAKIHGSEVLTLSDAIDLYCKKSFSFEDILQGIEPTFSGKKYENVKKDIMHIGKEMKNVKEYTQKGIVKCERYLQKKDELTEQEKNTLLREIRKTHNFISKQEIAAVLLDSYTSDLVNEKISDLNMITNDVELDRANSVKTVLLLYQSFQKGLEDLTGLLEETLSLV